MKYIALGPARIRVTRHINNIAPCSIRNDTVIFVQNGFWSPLHFESYSVQSEKRKFSYQTCQLSVLLRLSPIDIFWTESWLRHCATSRKVAGSIPDGVIGIFHWHNSSGRTVALGLIQPLTEMSTRNISCVGLTALPPSWADCLEIWEPQPPGTLRACPGL